MEFEFDSKKSESNKEKHGINFFDVQKLWQDKKRVEIPLKYVDKNRFIIISKIGEEYWSAIFTYRK